jgi:hypothetical protein
MMSSKKCFFNTVPSHADGSKFASDGCIQLKAGNQVRWVDTHRSAWDLIRCLTYLIRHLGETPDRFVVRFLPREARSRAQTHVHHRSI